MKSKKPTIKDTIGCAVQCKQPPVSKEKYETTLANRLMTDPSLYKPLGEAYKGWSCEVTKEGLFVYKPKKDGRK